MVRKCVDNLNFIVRNPMGLSDYKTKLFTSFNVSTKLQMKYKRTFNKAVITIIL